MEHLEKLTRHIISRVNINLRKPLIDVAPYLESVIDKDNLSLYYAFYALTPNHPLYFRFRNSSLAGTYFLGKCETDHSLVYKSDIRGDELKSRGTKVQIDGIETSLVDDEIILIKDSLLIKTLVHNNSHDPDNLETFKIINTAALHYANIHGSCVEGCFLQPFATVDLSTAHDCALGAYSYVQAGDLSHERIRRGRIWVKAEGAFEFNYSYPEDVLSKYIAFEKGERPSGIFMDFFEEREEDFIPIYSTVQPDLLFDVPLNASVSPYAVIKGNCQVGDNVLVSQRAYIENSSLGTGANAQENCYIINSVYDGLNVTAHGGKVIHSHLKRNVFVGFNSFVHGSEATPVEIGAESVVMPHTIIDATEPITIPDGSLVWGYITKQSDLETQCMSLDDFSNLKGQFSLGRMTFEGSGKTFVEAFKHRIQHILEENGAYYDGSEETMGHAQKTQDASFNIMQPYPEGELAGMFPNLTIHPLTPGRF